jgi:uncharacterized membrane protein
MTALIVKWVHILSAMAFLGTGGGSPWYKLRAWGSRDVRVVVWCDREIVRADWIFTVPSGVISPATGFWLAILYKVPIFSTSWILWGMAGYAVAGLAWLPAAVLQIKMRKLAEAALAEEKPLPPEYDRMQRTWAALGVPSFLAAIFVVWVMVAKWGL